MTRFAVLCRYGEIFLKGDNRRFFERKLVENMQRVVAVVGARVERIHGRVLVWPPHPTVNPTPDSTIAHAAGASIPATTDPNDPLTATTGGDVRDPSVELARTLSALQKVFGLTSVSPVRVVDKSMAAVTEAAVAEARAAVGDRRPSFKVETRRSDKQFQPASPEISRLVGGAIIEALGLPVDVHKPELTVGIEIGHRHAFSYARNLPGLGGLPIGTSGRVDLLLSGGIDSPVAGYLAMKRGCQLGATYFHSFPYTGDKTRDKVVRLGRVLAGYQGELMLNVVPFTDAQVAMRDAGEPRLVVVLYRRMMMRIAEALARARGAEGLVTGEALAQVASQTLTNMGLISAATPMTVLRPLITHDKVETMAWARRLGTYDISIEPYDDCCSLFVPEHPETRAQPSAVARAEARLDIPAIVAACVARTEVISCRP